MNCIVIDDEFPARAILERYIDKVPYLSHVASFKNAIEALSFVKEQRVDLMFVDIQMPGLTGTEFLRSMTTKPAAIFTTAYPEYALEGFELDVIDYLVKPISFDRFLRATEKAQNWLNPKSDTEEAYLSIKADNKIHKIKSAEIKYIEGAREYVTYHLVNGKLMSLQSLKSLEDILPETFIRVHKSYIVNRSYVTSYNSSVLGLDKVEIPIGKIYRNTVKALFSKQ